MLGNGPDAHRLMMLRKSSKPPCWMIWLLKGETRCESAILAV